LGLVSATPRAASSSARPMKMASAAAGETVPEDADAFIYSGGLHVADALLARQSSAASGKPALWRRRV